MMRRDGTWVFDPIQHRDKGGSWTNSSLDHFGHPPGFTASDKCWQLTGQSGCFDSRVAKAGLAWIRKRHPNGRFRLLLVHITQTTWPEIELENV